MKVYDTWTRQYLDYINKPVIKTVLDIGARRGESADKFVQFADMVYSFEPYKPDYDAISKHDGKVKAYNIAMYSTICSMPFDTSRGTGECRLSTDIKFPPCETTTIDTFCVLNNIKPDFIKIDTEGSEYDILLGGLNTIRSYRPQLAIACYHSTFQTFEVHQLMHNEYVDVRFECANYSNGKAHETILYVIPKEKAA